MLASVDVSTYRGVVTLFAFLVSLILRVRLECEAQSLHVCIPASVFAHEIEMHKETEEEAHGDHANQEAMTSEETRSIGGPEGESRDNATKITEA